MSFGLEAIGLVRNFGGLRAVDGVSFQLRPGELLTVFGPNGAGRPTSGRDGDCEGDSGVQGLAKSSRSIYPDAAVWRVSIDWVDAI